MRVPNEIRTGEINIQPILLKQLNIQLDVLRLDKIHPVVSGNKWFKLKYYLQQAIDGNYAGIATFGGAFSNHILAAAYACNTLGIKCTGFIRGEMPQQYSQTLLDAQALNMQLEFVSRAAFADKDVIMQAYPGLFFIPEGGYGKIGARGAAEILQLVPDLSAYDHIVCAAGTGTMLAGITNAALPHQQCIGISVLKNNLSLEKEMLALVEKQAAGLVRIVHDYHFGGYAKYKQQLIDFMNTIWLEHILPLDFVYTAKAFYAVLDMAGQHYFPNTSKILFVHSGGLQGNRSFKKGTLLF